MKFFFNDAYLQAFESLKEKLILAPEIIGPNWADPFKVMWDASGTVLDVVFGRKRNKMFYLIYYTSNSQMEHNEATHP